MDLNTLTSEIIGAAFEIRKNLGRFLYEDVYEEALQIELKLRGIESKRQVYLPVIYKEVCLEKSFRIDLLVEDSILIELKSLDTMGNKEISQILTYLKFSGKKVGFLINFGAADFTIDKFQGKQSLDKGIYRFVN